jgi:glycosyltransferase involved in cell wall biosynthesis
MVWYGQVQNIQGLYDVYPEGAQIPLIIAIPQRLQQPPAKMVSEYIQWVPWHKDIIPELARNGVLALLPYRQSKPAKSANRVLEALWSGLPVLTDPLPAVQDLVHGIRYLTSDLNSDIQSILTKDMTEEMQHAQKYIQEKYSPEVIGSQWADAFRSLV